MSPVLGCLRSFISSLRRKKLLLVVILLGVSAQVAHAVDVKLQWDAPPGTVTGYKIFYGTASGAYGTPVTVGNVTSHTLTGLPNGTLYFAVKAFNSGGDSGFSNEAVETPPSTPTSLALTPLSSTSLRATWTASMDNVTVSGYPRYRLDASISSTFSSYVSGYQDRDVGSVLTFDITGLSASTRYYVRVRAVDVGGNTSGNSSVANALTLSPPDTTAPTITITSPTDQPTFTTSSATVSLSGVANDNVGVTSVSWSNNGSAFAAATGTSSWSIASISLQVGENRIIVRATDAAGNVGEDTLTVTRADISAPTVPGNVNLTVLGTTSLRASWSAATDNVGVTAYEIDLATNSTFTTYVSGYQALNVGNVLARDVTGLTPGTTYYLRVRARDAAGNVSANSSTANGTTQFTPPVAPTNVRIVP